MGKTWHGGVIPTMVGSKIGLLSRPVWGKNEILFPKLSEQKVMEA
jgi:hypothetical protein